MKITANALLMTRILTEYPLDAPKMDVHQNVIVIIVTAGHRILRQKNRAYVQLTANALRMNRILTEYPLNAPQRVAHQNVIVSIAKAESL